MITTVSQPAAFTKSHEGVTKPWGEGVDWALKNLGSVCTDKPVP